MLDEDPTIVTASHYETLDKLLNSELYECLKLMPKPAVHHTHLTATASLDYLVSLTYNDFVYYSEKENKFFVSRKGCKLDGYMKVNTLRQYASNAEGFDNHLKELIKLTPERKEDHAIWKGFQYKFDLTFQLYNYADFFEKILYRSTKDYIKEMVTVVEYRHIFGCLFDDEGRTLSLKEELAIFDKVQKVI